MGIKNNQNYWLLLLYIILIFIIFKKIKFKTNKSDIFDMKRIMTFNSLNLVWLLSNHLHAGILVCQ